MKRLMTRLLLGLTAGTAGAGDLNPPPGSVAPTMKPLSQVEPRRPINATNAPGDGEALFSINGPGSYYLSGDLVGTAGKTGIRIAADGVTLDLMGFTVFGPPGALNGIASDESFSNVEIANGS